MPSQRQLPARQATQMFEMALGYSYPKGKGSVKDWRFGYLSKFRNAIFQGFYRYKKLGLNTSAGIMSDAR
jgi:hypothetical protein